MTRINKLYTRTVANPQGVSFRDFERLLHAFGFVEQRQRGSHRSFQHPACDKLLVVQPRGADAKPYQVRAFLDMIRDCSLELDE